jgi:hypothetical protein
MATTFIEFIQNLQQKAATVTATLVLAKGPPNSCLNFQEHRASFDQM